MVYTVNKHTVRKVIMMKPTIEVGDKFYNSNGMGCEVVKYYDCMDVVVKCDDGFYINKQAGALKRGQFKSPYEKVVYGVGYIGEGIFNPMGADGKSNKLYRAWTRMLRRCYDPKTQERQPSYKGCTVCPWWHNYQHFAADVHYLEGFEQWYENDIPYAWALDKDIKYPGNKIYSPDTCKFVSIEENCKHTGDWYK